MKFWPVLVLCLVVAGCSTKPVTDNRVSYDNARRIALQESAEKGDAEAQYALGESYCCGEDGFWDTKQAIYWWCQAAAQSHPQANARLEERKVTCPAQ